MRPRHRLATRKPHIQSLTRSEQLGALSDNARQLALPDEVVAVLWTAATGAASGKEKRTNRAWPAVRVCAGNLKPSVIRT